jgi:hypothetical protein
VGEVACAAQELDGLLAVADHVQLVADPVLLERFPGYQHV